MIASAALRRSPASAALKPGAKAPDFVTTGALGGKPFHLHLKQELRKGPVVLYFYPKAFTKGCTLEARAFSQAAPEFRKAGARVIGMSADDLPTLKRFSVEECRNAFPVATASAATIKAYGVSMPVVGRLKTMSNRTSFVIARRSNCLRSFGSRLERPCRKNARRGSRPEEVARRCVADLRPSD